MTLNDFILGLGMIKIPKEARDLVLISIFACYKLDIIVYITKIMIEISKILIINRFLKLICSVDNGSACQISNKNTKNYPQFSIKGMFKRIVITIFKWIAKNIQYFKFYIPGSCKDVIY